MFWYKNIPIVQKKVTHIGTTKKVPRRKKIHLAATTPPGQFATSTFYPYDQISGAAVGLSCLERVGPGYSVAWREQRDRPHSLNFVLYWWRSPQQKVKLLIILFPGRKVSVTLRPYEAWRSPDRRRTSLQRVEAAQN